MFFEALPTRGRTGSPEDGRGGRGHAQTNIYKLFRDASIDKARDASLHLLMKRYATATWAGPGKDGSGLLSTQSARLAEVPYSFTSRFEDRPDTNPEELIAAAHASCFTMKLSFVLGEAGYVPQLLETRCTILFEQGAITGSELALRARIPGISKADLLDSVKDAEVNCPVSRVLSCKISVQVLLEEA